MENTQFGEVSLMSLTKQVLLEERKRGDKVLTTEDIDGLLHEEHDLQEPRKQIEGYPSAPLYKELGKFLYQWTNDGCCPVEALPKYPTLDEQGYAETRDSTFKKIAPALMGLRSLWNDWNKAEKIHSLRNILKDLGLRGILDILGVRKTVGSKDVLPPAKSKLLKAFQAKHSSKAELSVGARALAKHFHRDQTMSWWGVSKGTEADKNRHALSVVEKILDGATWINIHWLPTSVIVLEVREKEGYGARWSSDGDDFRGFLEPHVEDGHTVGWKH